jgi:hypothetical protein
MRAACRNLTGTSNPKEPGMKRTGIGCMVAAGAVAAAVAALPASGQDAPRQRTLEFTSVQRPRDFKLIDMRPRGDSAGDRYTFSTTLRSGGKPAGRLEADCVAVDPTYQGLQCSTVAILADGRLTAQGAYLGKRVPGIGRVGEQYAITAGTGAYEGVTGVVRRHGGGKRDTLTLTLKFP